jgi:type II secretory pathway pseudopilin PulG
MKPEVIAAWIAATVAIIGTAATAILQVIFWRLDQREKRQQEIMQHRKEALLSALQVIDHVYANTAWNARPATNPHRWDITLARDAMNKMIIYCKNPDRTVEAFSKAVGLHNPDTQSPGTYSPTDLQQFRNIICDELELSPTNYANKEALWISKLPGTI